MVRVAVLVRAVLVESLAVFPGVVTERQDGAQVLRLHESKPADGREALAPVFDRAFEHRLRTHPHTRFGIIVEAAVDHLRRKILGMRRHP